MKYRPFEGDDWIGRNLPLAGKPYSIQTMSSAATGETAIASKGRKAVVYKLRAAAGPYYAFKVFEKLHAAFENIMSAWRLAPYAQMEGMEACKRETILPADSIVQSEPGLAFAVLMPWVPGQSWSEIIGERSPLTENECLAIARTTARILAKLEERQTAHADISSTNVFVERGSTPRVHLIDVEDMFHPHFHPPVAMPGGTPGYNHPQAARTTYWNQWGDRFAAAVILAEMLTWHQSDIRQQSGPDSYFQSKEMCSTSTDRYKTMIAALEAHSSDIATLFRKAWRSDTLSACPTLSEWKSVLAYARTGVANIRYPLKISSPIFGSLLNKDRFGLAQTLLLSRFSCTECGQFVRRDEPADHADTCSRHPNRYRPLIDSSLLSWLPKLDPAVKPKAGSSLLKKHLPGFEECPECGQIVHPPWGFHRLGCSRNTSTAPVNWEVCSECGETIEGGDASKHKVLCSRHLFKITRPTGRPGAPPAKAKPPSFLSYLKEPVLPAASEVCGECGSTIEGADARKHSLTCSRHPDYEKLKPSGTPDVWFAPLDDKPLTFGTKNKKDPSKLSFNPSFHLGELCPECGNYVSKYSNALTHKVTCSRNRKP